MYHRQKFVHGYKKEMNNLQVLQLDYGHFTFYINALWHVDSSRWIYNEPVIDSLDIKNYVETWVIAFSAL